MQPTSETLPSRYVLLVFVLVLSVSGCTLTLDRPRSSEEWENDFRSCSTVPSGGRLLLAAELVVENNRLALDSANFSDLYGSNLLTKEEKDYLIRTWGIDVILAEYTFPNSPILLRVTYRAKSQSEVDERTIVIAFVYEDPSYFSMAPEEPEHRKRWSPINVGVSPVKSNKMRNGSYYIELYRRINDRLLKEKLEVPTLVYLQALVREAPPAKSFLSLHQTLESLKHLENVSDSERLRTCARLARDYIQSLEH